MAAFDCVKRSVRRPSAGRVVPLLLKSVADFAGSVA